MSDLIERLEGLDGPCRECDAEIAKLLGLQSHEYVESGFGLTEIIAAKYTASIDAALKLVPEGLHWGIGQASDNLFIARLWKYAAEKIAENKHKHPAIAICIAALKAKGQAND